MVIKIDNDISVLFVAMLVDDDYIESQFILIWKNTELRYSLGSKDFMYELFRKIKKVISFLNYNDASLDYGEISPNTLYKKRLFKIKLMKANRTR